MSAADQPRNEYDVVVVGGGIVGVSAALRCVGAGAKVALVDAGFAGKASAAGAGIVSPVGLGGDEASQEWSTLVASAISHYGRILKQLDEAGRSDVGFARVGELVVASREQDLPRLDELTGRLKSFAEGGIPVGKIERMGGSKLRTFWPELREDLEGVFIENIARMDGRRMCAALGELAQSLGATLLRGIAAIKLEDDRSCSLVVDGTPIRAGTVILAAGAWSLPVLRELGVRLEVQPVRGQIVHLELPGLRTEARPVVNTFEGHYFLGFPGSRIVTGGTHEPEAAFDSRVTAGGVHSVLSKALRTAPGLAAATLVETRVGLRPRSSDGYPIVGRPVRADNIVVATGLGAWGLTLGPLIGEIAAEQALGLSPSFASEFLRPDREPIAAVAVLSPNVQ
jgi:D-amino-acid dehydrogenase